MSPLEILASVLGIIGVWLMIRQNIWGWPVGLVQVALTGWLVFDAKLYSDTIAQAVFFFLQAYGWWYWREGGVRRTPPPIMRLKAPVLVVWLIAIAALTGVHGWYMSHHTNAAFPWWDGFLLVLSLVAQWWQARKILECWAGWIVVNALYIWIYWVKDLRAFSLLSVVFLLMAVVGHLAWWRAWRVRRIAIFGPESTGKTMLAQKLAAHFHEPVVAEFAREFWDRKGAITLSDIPLIAQRQAENEDAQAEKAREILLCDTEALTTVLWSDLLYRDCPQAVRAAADLRASRYALYLLLNIDVPFTPDPQRVFPREADRERCLGLWRQALVARGIPFVEISGSWPEREAAAIAAITPYAAKKPRCP